MADRSATITRIKLRFERDFTQIPNAWIRDRRISRGARGLLQEIMSHDTASFQITIEALVGQGLEGRDAIRRMVGELERFGYLHRVQKRRSGGRLAGHDWVIQDPFEGVDNNGAAPLLTVSDFPTSVKPTSGPPSTVKPTPIEDQVKNKITPVPAQPQEPQSAPVDNFGTVIWADERCPGDRGGWGEHNLGKHGVCINCSARPSVRSAS